MECPDWLDIISKYCRVYPSSLHRNSQSPLEYILSSLLDWELAIASVALGLYLYVRWFSSQDFLSSYCHINWSSFSGRWEVLVPLCWPAPSWLSSYYLHCRSERVREGGTKGEIIGLRELGAFNWNILAPWAGPSVGSHGIRRYFTSGFFEKDIMKEGFLDILDVVQSLPEGGDSQVKLLLVVSVLRLSHVIPDELWCSVVSRNILRSPVTLIVWHRSLFTPRAQPAVQEICQGQPGWCLIHRHLQGGMRGSDWVNTNTHTHLEHWSFLQIDSYLIALSCV